MNSVSTKGKSINFLAVILILQFIVFVTVFFDIPVARQVLGFCCFTFLPGFLILKLKLNELDRVETVLFSVGLALRFETALINVSSNVLMALILEGRTSVI